MKSPRVRVLLLLATLLSGAVVWDSIVVAAPTDPAIELPIVVRTFVDKPYGFRRKPAEPHGRLYAIVGINQTEESSPLVKPVLKGALLNQLREVLKGQGFREIVAGEKPEILMTVVYGRGFLRNPYMTDVIYNEITETPLATILGGNNETLARAHEPHYEARLQEANHEKLFIRVNGWDLAKDAKGKAKLLWHTTMIYHDPTRDLNVVFKEMLFSGGSYFDRELESEEVRVDPSRTGKVDVGTPEVVKPAAKPQLDN